MTSQCSSPITAQINVTIASLLKQFGANSSCANPCSGPTMCQNQGMCVPAASGPIGYDCKCLPGYSGRFCEIGE